ncbi:Uncharacterized protein ALO57_01066 [Pseudomonas coronafaciens pv. oryzae]|uniref:hypothetical protein n=1 Tax=Pseudomonas coronafaciens TaxID=53409 RepID=UPI0006CD154A|nr:hypothetical protein [Pseudomonas coronafaciens]KPB54744.1 Uncharacterized protein AC511_3454 [Pseudomonas coronafaciens pv. oryzae]KPY05645.1 Uncharacterized protein ALO57_01066 [Pseudomonas coronafaciens pv. oryzae]RMT01101.1 hypothetical protein ALP55_02454 [Pseudomonas coronafaciens pv. oryzae]
MKKNSDFVLTADRSDELSKLLREPKQNNRHDIWIWLCLYHYRNVELEPATCNGTTMRSAITHALKRNSNLLEGINREKDRSLVPDDCFQWIDRGERQYQWLLDRIKRITDLRLSQRLVHLTGRDHLIALLDLWDVDIADKADAIKRLRNDWLRHKAKDSDFEWFEDKKEGPQRCRCAWEWLQKNRLSGLSRRDPISNYQELLMFFDQAEYGPAEQKAIIKEIRQRWSRQQHGERTVAAGKKQVNVELSKTVISLLDDLAKKHQLKRPQVLERLIMMESERGLMETHFTRHASGAGAADTSQGAQESSTGIQESAINRAPRVDSALQPLSRPRIDFVLTAKDPTHIDAHSADTCMETAPHDNASSHLEKDLPHPDPQTAEEDLLDNRPLLSAGISLKGRVNPRKRK